MILTSCAACAAPLAHNAPRCIRCHTRYCNSTYYASSLKNLSHFGEAKSLLRKVMPVARRVLGDNDGLTLKMRWIYAQSLYRDAGASLDDLREAVSTLEDAERTARRVLGGSHPATVGIEAALREARAALQAPRH